MESIQSLGHSYLTLTVGETKRLKSILAVEGQIEHLVLGPRMPSAPGADRSIATGMSGKLIWVQLPPPAFDINLMPSLVRHLQEQST